MISKENIKKGLDTGLISVTLDKGGCCGICCEIGNYAFYFLAFDEVPLEEFWTKYSKEEITTMIWSVIKNKETAEKNGLSEEEQEYYEELLKNN